MSGLSSAVHRASTKGTDSVIQIEGLVVRYGGYTAVEGLDLHIQRGELFGLLGPNGAGKSSTIKVLIGQRRPSGGKVTILGHDVVRDWTEIKPRFGYVPDRENHFDELTGRGNLEIFAGLYNVPAPRIEQCLWMVELTESANLKVRGYSLGMRKKLLIARALLHRPEILYLDEPTANLDAHSAAVVHRTLRDLLVRGCTIVMTTHNMEEVQEICSRVAILCKGKLVALDSPFSLRRQQHEHLADVILTDETKLVINLDDPNGRAELAGYVSAGRIGSVQTREFDFHAAFLKLTGTQFD
jgi:ABC-type multidrug transport system ATPase subunit